MLAAIRTFAKSWVAAILMGLLIVSFAVWGIRDVFGGRISNSVMTAGSRQVSAQEFRRDFDRAKSQYEQQSGQTISNEAAVEGGLDRQLLDELATREALGELLRKLGITPSDKLVASQIEKIPAFFDPVSGRFDKASYQQRLGENGYSPQMFEQEIRDEVAEQHLATGLVAGLLVPRAYTAMAAVFELEGRDVALVAIDPKDVGPPAAPTDAQLTTFMKENASNLMRPEFRQLTVVQITPDQVAGNAPIDPAELQKRFNFRKDTLSKPETRTIVQIPAKDAAAADQIIARLGRGETPDAVAKALGVEAITFADKPQTAIPDKKLAQAAFQMKPGQAAAVQGDLALAVVKVEAVTPGHQVTLEEVKPALEAEIRKDAAAEKVYERTQAYDDAHEKGASLAEAANKAGLQTATIGPVTKDGRDQQGRPVPGLDPKVMATAFALPAGGESDLEDNGSGGYYAVRVEKVIPPALPDLAAIRADLAKAWMMRELNTRMQAKADELAARVRKGESLDAVAASLGAKPTPVTGLTRAGAASNQTVSQDVMGHVFTAKLGDVFTARNSRFGYVVGKLEAIHAGQGPTLPQMAESARSPMTLAFVRELQQAAQLAARNKIKVRIDAERARAALGVDVTGKTAPGKPRPAL